MESSTLLTTTPPSTVLRVTCNTNFCMLYVENDRVATSVVLTLNELQLLRVELNDAVRILLDEQVHNQSVREGGG
jgi:hypothetical protein